MGGMVKCYAQLNIEKTPGNGTMIIFGMPTWISELYLAILGCHGAFVIGFTSIKVFKLFLYFVLKMAIIFIFYIAICVL